MLDIKINIGDVLDTFFLSKEEVNGLRRLVVETYVLNAYSNTVELAQQQLNSTRNEYISALQIKKEDEFTYSLILNGSKIAAMVEMGSGPFDMKEGFSKSSKIKPTKSGGWYLTIPFKFRTTAANPISGNAGQLLPRRIYDLIRSQPSFKTSADGTVISILKNKDIPERYQPKPKSVINELANKAEQYIPKSSIYADLVRRQNPANGLSTYNTFRRVSDKSDPRSWLHPGIQAHNLMDEGIRNVDQDETVWQALEKLFE